MKKLLFVLALVGIFSCSDDGPAPIDPVDPVDPVSETINVTGMLQGTHNWTSNNTYVLNQKVVVDAGATLNIEAGDLRILSLHLS